MSHLDHLSANLADRRIREWFVQENARRAHERAAAQPKLRPERSVVTISRQYGAGGHTFAELLAAKLGHEWRVWDKEIVDLIAENGSVRKDMVDALDERARTVMEHLINGLIATYPFTEEKYRNGLAQVLASIAHHGHQIIIGRGGNFILDEALNIRLIAAQEYRIETIARREGLSRVEAVAKINKVDAERSAFIRGLYGRDVEDPSGYDLVLRMDSISPETAVAAVAAGVSQHSSEIP